MTLSSVPLPEHQGTADESAEASRADPTDALKEPAGDMEAQAERGAPDVHEEADEEADDAAPDLVADDIPAFPETLPANLIEALEPPSDIPIEELVESLAVQAETDTMESNPSPESPAQMA